MSLPQSLKAPLPPRADWLGLVLMSLSAPWIAAFIHSACVFRRGIRLYNAEVGGIFFNGSMPPYPQPGLGSVLLWISGCAVPAALTFLFLVFLRRRAAYRWLAWVCFVALWTWACFKTEIAYH